MAEIILKDLSYKITGILFKIHKELGRFCRERQYGDLFEKILIEEKIPFIREKPIEIADRKSNFIDFIIDDCLIIELKNRPFVSKEDYYQVKRYLETANKELGMIVNFRNEYLKPKRVLNPKYSGYSNVSD